MDDWGRYFLPPVLGSISILYQSVEFSDAGGPSNCVSKVLEGVNARGNFFRGVELALDGWFSVLCRAVRVIIKGVHQGVD